MRIAGQKKNKKSWCLKLTAAEHLVESPDIYLSAVDEDTEDVICTIIRFSANGEVVRLEDVHECLDLDGYNPFEHDNHFDSKGRIILDEN